MKKALHILFSMPVTGLLLLGFAISIAYATFIENDFGTDSAKILVYDSGWFKALLILFAFNLTGSIFINKIISRKKWTMFLFHLSFLIILAGGALTRYTGMTGNMHIREGEASNQYITDNSFLTIQASLGGESVSSSKAVKFSERTKNRFKESISVHNEHVIVENIQYIPSAGRTLVEDANGGPVVSMVVIGTQNQRLEFFLEEGEEKNFNNIVFSFNHPSESTTVLIEERMDRLVLTAMNNELSGGDMGSELTRLPSLEEFPLQENQVYQIGHLKFLLKQYLPRGRTRVVYDATLEDESVSEGLRMKISTGDQSEIVEVFGSSGLPGQAVTANFKNLQVSVSFGSKIQELPFSLRLDDFQIERYPGSNSPSSFASKVTLFDIPGNREIPFRIFMNNILKHKGYRFFQSSYDQDEKGTILSVNYDSRGTLITYLGYLLMTLGMVLSLFNRNSRFHRLIKASSRLHARRSLLLLIGLALFSVSGAQVNESTGTVDKVHARSFGELLLQTNEGRIEPVNSLASKILRKVYRKSSFEGLSPVEVFLDMTTDPGKWSNIQMIRISSPDLKKILGVSGNYASMNELMSGGYKLSGMVETAYGKSASLRSKTDKEVIVVDERVNICYLALTGEFLKIFPIPGDASRTWIQLKSSESRLPPENKEYAIRVLSNYMTAVREAKYSGDWALADNLLNELKVNQFIYGASVIPAQARQKLEIFYINSNIFSKLSKLYLFAGVALLLMSFLNIFKPKIRFYKVITAGVVLVGSLFFLHTLGLALRWYISGHAPWSNGYESMLFIGWATTLSGLVFIRRSQMALAVSIIFSAVILFVAGLSWMSPEITNLEPVLKSYWLIVHVAIVTASYGFFGIGSLLGLSNLVLLILLNESNKTRINFTIRELSYIIEISLILGLYMLAIGSFIGGVWANESWGRYWGWDPKETWALVTILLYSFVVHMHRIPGFKGYFQLSTAALLGFGSVLMTYFGVNYYFSGLHSYATGDTPPIPKGVFLAGLAILLLILSAYISQRKHGPVSLQGDSLLEEN